MRDEKEKLDRIVAGVLRMPRKVVDPLGSEKQREKASARKEIAEEWKRQTLLNTMTTDEDLDYILNATLVDPREDERLHTTYNVLRAAVMLRTLRETSLSTRIRPRTATIGEMFAED
jgi:hypothetical protein